jgi:hypothetical protein
VVDRSFIFQAEFTGHESRMQTATRLVNTKNRPLSGNCVTCTVLIIIVLFTACAPEFIVDGDPRPLESRTNILVYGHNINKPGSVIWTNGITLMDVIELSNGYAKSPPSRIKVFPRDGSRPRTYSVGKIMTGKAVDPKLQPGDEVVVPEH